MPTQIPTVYVIRHGKTHMNSKDNQKDPIRSWSNPPLDTEGKEEAEVVAKVLQNKGIVRIFHSDLDRAKETAKIIAEKVKAPLTSLFGLRPWNLGVFIGHPLDKNLPKIMWYETHRDAVVKDGEAYDTFLKRFGKVLEDAKRYVIANPEKSIALVTHSQNLVALRNRLSHDRFPIEPMMQVKVGEVIKITFPSKSTYSIQIINEGSEKGGHST